MTVGSDLEIDAVLLHIVEAAVKLVDARYGALGVLNDSGTGLRQFIPIGIDDDTRELIGALPEGHGILGLLIRDPRPIRLPDLEEHPDSYGFPPNHPPMKSFLGVPIRVRGQVFGNLYLTDKTSAEVFTDIDEELVVALATAAGVAVENARLHERVRQLALVEERERIARDLHDTVIQRLFAAGLRLAGVARFNPTPEIERSIAAAADDLDLTVRHIRTVIFDLESSRSLAGGVRHQVLQVVGETAALLGFEPRVVLDGPVDDIGDQIATQALAVLREALSNVARHAEATWVEVDLIVGSDVVLRVSDDGRGLTGARPPQAHGLLNMNARAVSLGGSMSAGTRPEGGTVVEWRVPCKP